MTYLAQGANAYLVASYIGTSFGRKNFAQAFAVLAVGVQLLVGFSYSAVGKVLTMFGNYRPTKLVFGIMMIFILILSLLMEDGYIAGSTIQKIRTPKWRLGIERIR